MTEDYIIELVIGGFYPSKMSLKGKLNYAKLLTVSLCFVYFRVPRCPVVLTSAVH